MLMRREWGSFLCDLSKSSSLLSEINNHAYASPLRATDGFLDCKYEVWLASADVGAEYVRPIAYDNVRLLRMQREVELTFVVDTQRELLRFIGHIGWVAD
jgi:hypothetical protein